MAGQVSILDNTFVVASALTNGVSRYHAVVLDTTDNECTYGAAANAGKFAGIAQEDASASMPVNVRQIGTTWVVATGVVNQGDDCMIGDANGTVASVQTTAQASPVIIGKAITKAPAAGDLFLMLVKA